MASISGHGQHKSISADTAGRQYLGVEADKRRALGSRVKSALRAAIEAAVTWQNLIHARVDREPKMIAIDAGHGKHFLTTTAWTGTWGRMLTPGDREDVLALEIARQVAHRLKSGGHRVFETGTRECDLLIVPMTMVQGLNRTRTDDLRITSAPPDESQE